MVQKSKQEDSKENSGVQAIYTLSEIAVQQLRYLESFNDEESDEFLNGLGPDEYRAIRDAAK